MKLFTPFITNIKVNHPPVPTPVIAVTLPKPNKPLVVERKKKT